MTIEIKTGIRYEYKCPITGDLYVEQRHPEEPQFFTKSPSGADYVLISQTEFTYEQEVPDLITESTTEVIEEPVVE